jgi:hypothetical protein
MLQTLHFLSVMAGHFILPEKNSAGWASDLGPRLGGLRILIKTTRYVSSNFMLPYSIDFQKPALSDVSSTARGSDENQ